MIISSLPLASKLVDSTSLFTSINSTMSLLTTLLILLEVITAESAVHPEAAFFGGDVLSSAIILCLKRELNYLIVTGFLLLPP